MMRISFTCYFVIVHELPRVDINLIREDRIYAILQKISRAAFFNRKVWAGGLFWFLLYSVYRSMVYSSRPSKGRSDFSEGCPKGAARGTSRGKVLHFRALVGGILFFQIKNIQLKFTDRDKNLDPSLRVKVEHVLPTLRWRVEHDRLLLRGKVEQTITLDKEWLGFTVLSVRNSQALL